MVLGLFSLNVLGREAYAASGGSPTGLRDSKRLLLVFRPVLPTWMMWIMLPSQRPTKPSIFGKV
jgi:hypothetical protein